MLYGTKKVPTLMQAQEKKWRATILLGKDYMMKSVVSVKRVFGEGWVLIKQCTKKVHPYQHHLEQYLADLTHSMLILLSLPTPI